MTRPQNYPIRMDESRHLTVLLCAECPAWRESANTRAEANRLAGRHLADVHGDARLAADYSQRVERMKGTPQL